VTSECLECVAAVTRVGRKQARSRQGIKGKNEERGRVAEAGRFRPDRPDLDMPHVIVEVAAP